MALDQVDVIAKSLIERKWMLAVSESCTGGLLCAQIIRKHGASSHFERGFVTYSNEAKMECLGVPPETLNKHGAVSAETAEEMALGTLKHSNANIAISITGIAGPEGGNQDKPVGLVYFGYALKNIAQGHNKQIFVGDREEIQNKAVEHALILIEQIIQNH